jgi:O-acetyl-ADP-ribose deacetylase (regulator of RNase III)
MILLRKGDITQAEVDAIVNAANPIMLGGGGVDGAIHRAAGPKLLEACRKVKPTNGVRCPFGEARITSAGGLQAKFVIHAVGPRYGRDPEPHQLLASAYRNSLELALENQCGSIAFPAISCGAYGYPVDEAAAIAVATCSDFADRLEMTFYLFSDELLDVWRRALDSLQGT